MIYNPQNKQLNRVKKMSQKYKVFQVDSFTDTKFYGNPVGVVLDADGLTDQKMQKIAREMNVSETVM